MISLSPRPKKNASDDDDDVGIKTRKKMLLIIHLVEEQVINIRAMEMNAC